MGQSRHFLFQRLGYSPEFNTLAIPPVAIGRVKKAQVICRILCLKLSFTGQFASDKSIWGGPVERTFSPRESDTVSLNRGRFVSVSATVGDRERWMGNGNASLRSAFTVSSIVGVLYPSSPGLRRCLGILSGRDSIEDDILFERRQQVG